MLLYSIFDPQSDCALLLDGTNLEEEDRVVELLSERAHAKVPIYEETYDEMTTDCKKFKKDRGYITIPLTEEEEKFPLAFRYRLLCKYNTDEIFIQVLKNILKNSFSVLL